MPQPSRDKLRSQAGFKFVSVLEYVQSKIDRLFWSHVDKTESCWLWTAGKTRGYGYLGLKHYTLEKPVRISAHRLSWQLFVGSIPDGMQIDHLCKNPSCVRPDHLEVVTPKENNHRSDSPSAVYAKRTHCRNGHPYEGDNVRVAKSGNKTYRQCVTCYQEYWRRKQREKFASLPVDDSSHE